MSIILKLGTKTKPTSNVYWNYSPKCKLRTDKNWTRHSINKLKHRTWIESVGLVKTCKWISKVRLRVRTNWTTIKRSFYKLNNKESTLTSQLNFIRVEVYPQKIKWCRREKRKWRHFSKKISNSTTYFHIKRTIFIKSKSCWRCRQ